MILYFQGLMSPGSEDLKQRLELLVECSILSLCAYQKDAASGEPSNKVGSKLVHLSEKVMESSLGVLPTRIFINLLGLFPARWCQCSDFAKLKTVLSAGGLLRNAQDVVRRKALDVFVSKAQHRGDAGESLLEVLSSRAGGGEEDVKTLITLLEPLSASASGKVASGEEEKETEHNQQLALVALR